MCPKNAVLLQDTCGRHLLHFSYRADCWTVALEPLTTQHIWVRKSHPHPTWSKEAQKDIWGSRKSAMESGTGARMPEAHSCTSRAVLEENIWLVPLSLWVTARCWEAPNNSSAKHVSFGGGDCGQQQSSLSPLRHSVPEKLVITKYHLFITTYFSVFKSVVLRICQWDNKGWSQGQMDP